MDTTDIVKWETMKRLQKEFATLYNQGIIGIDSTSIQLQADFFKNLVTEKKVFVESEVAGMNIHLKAKVDGIDIVTVI